MRKKVSIYARSGNVAPAGYYRIIQYVNSLDNVDVRLRPMLSNWQFRFYLKFVSANRIIKFISYGFFFPLMIIRISLFLLLDLLRCPDYIILSRVFIPRKPPFFIKLMIHQILRKSKLIWDFDDHILENKQIVLSDFLYLARMSKHIIVIHEYLKFTIPREFWNKVILLPTTDGSMFNNHNKKNIAVYREQRFYEELALVWVATSGNLFHLERIIKSLDTAAKKVNETYKKKITLTVVCDKPMKIETSYLNVKNIYWTRDRAIEEMKNAHLGIMPLKNSTFAKGKGGFKLIQYISIGLPVLASDVGFNSKIVDSNCGYLIDDSVTSDRWEHTLCQIASNYNDLERMSKSAYKRWEEKFSFENNLQVWKNLIQ